MEAEITAVPIVDWVSSAGSGMRNLTNQRILDIGRGGA